jgi:hypothetical protein
VSKEAKAVGLWLLKKLLWVVGCGKAAMKK